MMHPAFTQRLLVPTHLGRHATIRTMILRARNAGIDVEHEHDTRIFTRQHLLILTGPRKDVCSFVRAWGRHWGALRRGRTAQDLRRQRQQERQRIGAFFATVERKYSEEAR